MPSENLLRVHISPPFAGDAKREAHAEVRPLLAGLGRPPVTVQVVTTSGYAGCAVSVTTTAPRGTVKTAADDLQMNRDGCSPVNLYENRVQPGLDSCTLGTSAL